MKDLSELYETLANESIVAFIAIDKKTRHFTYANKLARSLFEIGEKKISSISLDKILPQEKNEAFLPLTNDMVDRQGYYTNLMITKINGTKFIGNVSTKNITLHNDELTLIMCQDVTQQRKLQREITAKQEELESSYQELLTQNAQLKELDLAKTRFIALTTHELRTPLSAMVGSSELLKEKLYDTDEQRDEFIEMIYDQGLHLMELVNDILDFAKVTSGKMDYYITQQDVTPVINMLVEQFEPMAEQDKIKLEYNKPDTDLICYFDEIRVKQIISNILSNAIKYNKPEGSVTVSMSVKENFVEIEVKDTGKGIAKEDLEQVFNEFETLGKVANHQKGTGLGMPITKRLIEGMGGEINLTSELGVGSTFSVTIPTEKVLDDESYRERDDLFDLAAS